MGKLKSDFPGYAALEAAGEATHAKVEKRIKDGTLTDVPGIGKSTASQIEEALENEDEEAREKNGDEHEAKAGQQSAGGTLVNDGTVDQATVDAAEAEANKTGRERNEELENHALDQPPKSAAFNADNPLMKTQGDMLAYSGVVFYDIPEGPFVSKEPQPQLSGRVKTLPISQVNPRAGMEVHDGDIVYALDGSFDRSCTPNDWLRVRNPETGELLVGPSEPNLPGSEERQAGRRAAAKEGAKQGVKDNVPVTGNLPGQPAPEMEAAEAPPGSRGPFQRPARPA